MKLAIQFSGGKDSLAVLYLARPMLGQATVYFGDTGGVYPHVLAFIHRTCTKLGAELKIVRPPVSLEEHHGKYGLPADIVPVEASAQMQPFVKRADEPLLQSNLSCCNAMLWQPMMRAMLADGIRIVLRGSKAADAHVGVGDGFIDENGILYGSPLWQWSDADVFAYLADVGAELPEHYEQANNSFDCILCTAFLKSAGAKQRLEYTRAHYPDEWVKLRDRLNTVRSIMDRERAALDAAFSAME